MGERRGDVERARIGLSYVLSALRTGILAFLEWLMDPYGEYLVVALDRRMSQGTSLSGEPSWDETTIAGDWECAKE